MVVGMTVVGMIVGMTVAVIVGTVILPILREKSSISKILPIFFMPFTTLPPNKTILDQIILWGDSLTLPLYSPISVLQNEGEEAAHDPGSALEEVQVHGPAAPLHQAVLQGGVPTGAAALQHLGGCHQP